GAVHVRLGGEMQHVGDVVLADDAADLLSIPKVYGFEHVFWVLRCAFEAGEVSRVGQAIEVDQAFDLGPIEQMANEIRSDEPGAAGDEQMHAVWSAGSG